MLAKASSAAVLGVVARPIEVKVKLCETWSLDFDDLIKRKSNIMKYFLLAMVLLSSISMLRAESTDGTINFASQENPVFISFGGSAGKDTLFVQLFWSPVENINFTPVSGGPVGFLSGEQAGFWDASSEPVVTTPGLIGGSQVLICARVWGGSAIDDVGNGIWNGMSVPITITTGNYGSPLSPPASIAAMPSFMVVEAMPEPSTIVLGLLGALVMFQKRWKTYFVLR